MTAAVVARRMTGALTKSALTAANGGKWWLAAILLSEIFMQMAFEYDTAW